MANLNKVFLMGNLTRDPELRYTPSGTAVCDFGLAVNRRWRGQDGEQRDETCFVDITAWARQAEVISEYCRKGRPLFVEGRLRLDSWETQDGQKRSKLKVTLEGFQFIGGRGDGGRSSERGESGDQPRKRAPAGPPQEQDKPQEDAGFSPGDDDIPF